VNRTADTTKVGLLHPGVSTRGDAHVLDLAPDCDLSGRIEINGSNNRVAIGAGSALKPCAPAGFAATVPDMGRRSDASLSIDGNDNRVEIEDGVQLALNIVVRGDGNRIRIAPACHLHGFVNLIADGATLEIGTGTTMVQGSIQLHEPLSVIIGSDCMISSQVYISASDIHPIYDRATGARINAGRSVEIGDHVWLGLRTMVLKGSHIGTGAITAAGALVSGNVPAHAIVGGAPARVLRQNVNWQREFGANDVVLVPPASKAWPWWSFRR